MSNINFFAKTNFRNQERIFGIKEDDRRRHMYVIGKTGMGKSNLMENMAIQDIRNGKGVCFIDPHGDGAEKLMRSIPSDRINDVVYFNPADTDYPVAFNILEAVDEDKKNLIASGMMGVFKKIWPDVWSARMEYILNNTILALLDYPGSTMLGVNRMMSDKDFRKRIYPKIKDPIVKGFWLNEFEMWEDKFRKEAVAAIQNKVGQFLSSSVTRHVIGQPKSTIDMREIMDNGKILIVNLSKGRIGEDTMRLLGGMIVTKLQLAAMGRVEIPESERKDFYMYVDEFQNFVTESFANILSEARKYRLCLIIGHQYINQLMFDGNAVVRDAVFGNVGTMILFRVGADDAEYFEKEFAPAFEANDIVNLAKYTAYIKLMIDGIAGDAFSAVSLSPADVSDTAENEQKAVRVSRERYSRPRAEVEEKIARWSGMMDLSEFEASSNQSVNAAARNNSLPKLTSNNLNNNGNRNNKIRTNNNYGNSERAVRSASPVSLGKDERSQFETVCSTCEEKIIVPFKPDPARPTFCKECLKDYQRARARAQQERDQRNNPPRNMPAPEKKDIFVPDKVDYKPKVFVSAEKPLSLNQISHIAPKKFKSPKKSIAINLDEVRNLINQTKNNNKNES